MIVTGTLAASGCTGTALIREPGRPDHSISTMRRPTAPLIPLKVCLENAGPAWEKERPSDLKMMEKYHADWLGRVFAEVVRGEPDCDLAVACAYTAYERTLVFRELATGRELFTAYAKFTGMQAAAAKNRVVEELIARFRTDRPLYQSIIKRQGKPSPAPALAAKVIAPPPAETTTPPPDAVAVASDPAPPPAENPKPKKREPMTAAQERAIDDELLP